MLRSTLLIGIATTILLATPAMAWNGVQGGTGAADVSGVSASVGGRDRATPARGRRSVDIGPARHPTGITTSVRGNRARGVATDMMQRFTPGRTGPGGRGGGYDPGGPGGEDGNNSSGSSH